MAYNDKRLTSTKYIMSETWEWSATDRNCNYVNIVILAIARTIQYYVKTPKLIWLFGLI